MSEIIVETQMMQRELEHMLRVTARQSGRTADTQRVAAVLVQRVYHRAFAQPGFDNQLFVGISIVKRQDFFAQLFIVDIMNIVNIAFHP